MSMRLSVLNRSIRPRSVSLTRGCVTVGRTKVGSEIERGCSLRDGLVVATGEVQGHRHLELRDLAGRWRTGKQPAGVYGR
jgi:hypothetical protein